MLAVLPAEPVYRSREVKTVMDFCEDLAEPVAFGPFELFPQQRSLLRDGQRVQLGSRALDVLLILVARAGALVPKAELIARVWPDTHVEEVALRVHMAALRRILSEGRPNARDLITVPGRGYQFVAPVSPINVIPDVIPSAEQEGRQQWTLPSLPARVIGRERDTDLILARLNSARCTTITGPGGIGKTTVGLAAGHRAASRFQDGAFFVDLASISGADQVVDAIAAAAGIPSVGTSVEQLAEMLQLRDALVVVDNCEHVIGQVSEVVANLATAGSGLRILATSREPLRIPGESVYRLPALPTPSCTIGLSAAEAITYPAVEFFVDRAVAINGRFRLDDRNAPTVAAICGQLDGLALAIELAATRMDTFGVADIAAMLKDRFRVLQGSRHAALGRHSSLSATLDWSYDMLEPQTKMFLHRISSFAGRFTVDDAIRITDDLGFSRGDVVLSIGDLVDKSFLTVDLAAATAHYRLYESMREYGRQKSRCAGDLDETRRCHALYMARLFTQAYEEWKSAGQSEWLADYGRYLDDVRLALDWLLGPTGDRETGIALWNVCFSNGEVRKGLGLTKEPKTPLKLQRADMLASHQVVET